MKLARPHMRARDTVLIPGIFRCPARPETGALIPGIFPTGPGEAVM